LGSNTASPGKERLHFQKGRGIDGLNGHDEDSDLTKFFSLLDFFH